MISATIALLLLSFASISAFIAGQRGYGMLGWYFAGLLLGPLGLVVALLPKATAE